MVRNLLRSSRKFAPSYFDDVFVHSPDMDGQTDVGVHRIHFRNVFLLMREHKLYDSLKKCIFDARETPISGCIVGKHGVQPDPDKIKAITDWPVPTNVKGPWKFLGLAADSHKCSRNYTDGGCHSLRSKTSPLSISQDDFTPSLIPSRADLISIRLRHTTLARPLLRN